MIWQAPSDAVVLQCEHATFHLSIWLDSKLQIDMVISFNVSKMRDFFACVNDNINMSLFLHSLMKSASR